MADDSRARAQQQQQPVSTSSSGGALGSLAGVTRYERRKEKVANERASIDFALLNPSTSSSSLPQKKKTSTNSFLSGRRGLPGSVRALRAAVVNSVTSNASSATASEAAAAVAGALAPPPPPPPRHRSSNDAAFEVGGGEAPDADAATAAAAPTLSRDSSASPPPPTRSASEPRMARFDALLNPPGGPSAAVDLRSLRELAWSGVPPRLRGTVWKLLLGYLPAERSRRGAFLARKRAEYAHFIPAHYEGAAAAGAAVRGGGNGGGGSGSRSGNAGRSSEQTQQQQQTQQHRHQSNAAAPPLPFQSQHLSEEAAALRQVQVDAPRTAPGVPLFARPDVQRALVRLLYLWGVRHPASGYVQGINDLATPLLAAFFADAAAGDGDGVGSSSGSGGGSAFSFNGGCGASAGASTSNNSSPLLSPGDPAWQGVALPEGAAEAAEADAYWCLCRLLEGVQDHYTHGQPGIRRCAAAVDELVARVDSPLARHLREENVECLQFAFRWANCLLAREMPLRAAMRLFDTWVAEGASGVAAGQGGIGGGGGGGGGGSGGGGSSSANGQSTTTNSSSLPPSASSLADFLAYACASFLVGWREELLRLDFQGAVMFLQRPPTARWGETDVEPVLSRAFLWRAQFGGAPSHLGRR